MPERIEGRSLIATLGALLVLVGLFLNWYEPDVSAWEAFEVWDVVLAAVALAVLYASFEEISGRPGLSERWPLVLGVAALVIVVSQLLTEPPAVAGSSPESGIWLALAGSALISLAGLLSTARISFAIVSDRGERRSPATHGGERAEQRPTEPVERD